MDLVLIGEVPSPTKKTDVKSLLLVGGSILALGWLLKEIFYSE